MALTQKSVRQAAALAVRDGRVYVVTSSSGKRWLLPKGCCEPGKSEGQIALQEAWEEAGLVGVLHREPVGSYLHKKGGEVFHVTVFLMRVTLSAVDWPERFRRRRAWLTPAGAINRITHRGLREVIRAALAARA